jgi:hypothetical protein
MDVSNLLNTEKKEAKTIFIAVERGAKIFVMVLLQNQ